MITDIEITEMPRTDVPNCGHAVVNLRIANRVVTVFCTLDFMPGTESVSRSRAYTRDALRQLGRMPEYRTGGRIPELASNLTPSLT